MKKLNLYILLIVTFFVKSIGYTSLLDVKEVILKIENCNPDTVSFSSIEGGATNQNYVGLIGGQKYFIREISKETGELLNTNQHEYDCITKTSFIGLSPPLVCYDLSKGVIITTFIEPETSIDFNDSKIFKDCIFKIHQLHNSDLYFLDVCNPIDIVKNYYKKAKELSISLPSEIKTIVLPFIEKISNQYTLPQKLAPCHLDLHAGNFLINNNKTWLIDWEYSAMSDPLFDLAILASTENFSPDQESKLLSLYYKNSSEEIEKKYYLMRVLADARWAIWCFLQKNNSTLDFPYEEEGDRFVLQCMDYISLASH